MLNWWCLIYVYSFNTLHMVYDVYWSCYPFSILSVFVITFFKEFLQIFLYHYRLFNVSVLLIYHVVKWWLISQLIWYVMITIWCCECLNFFKYSQGYSCSSSINRILLLLIAIRVRMDFIFCQLYHFKILAESDFFYMYYIQIISCNHCI